MQLFRFATKADIILMVLGSIAALAMGASLPAFALLWGSMTDSFAEGGDTMVNKAKDVMFIFFAIAAGVLVAGWVMFAGWMITG
jgi:ATP-binding cassette subfamily B (MDR/TAP) protein 1